MKVHIAVLALGLLASPLLAWAAEPPVRLDVDDLIELADPGRGECYTVAPPQDRIPHAAPRLFVYRAAQVGDVVTFRVPVPADGYVLEAAISFEAMGWRTARIGDRFPFALILVDRDPNKPAGRQFDQYGWNFGGGSTSGMGEARLMADGNAVGELIPEREKINTGQPVRYVGTIDVRRSAVIEAIELIRPSDAKTLARYDVDHELPDSGRYRLMGELPAAQLQPGRYELRIAW